MSAKQSRNIIIVGASGTVGKSILNALLSTGLHKISILSRADSNAKFPVEVTTHKGDYSDAEFLESALKGNDVLIMALSFMAYSAQTPLIRAAAKVGVSWIVPTEYGSDATAALNEHIDLMNVKKQYRDLIEELGVSSWVGVVCNPWFDWILKKAAFGVNLKARTFSIMQGQDDGNTKANLSTLGRVGESMAALFSLPEDELRAYRNEWVYFSSIYATQREILEACVRATGTKESDWTLPKDFKSWDKIHELKEAAVKGDMSALPHLLLVLTFTPELGGDYNSKVIDYKKLGLEPEENLDDIVKRVVQELGA